ncbi:cysteine-rich small domain-containing protein [Pseudodesulfovibrio sediminis]|uniref:Metal-binding protein n=1 Tax=Pseudodesulfovibrio sediminis TaxID=2810563 RepID=A0ABM7P6L0_9BACT|nr:cysteine-rich small domain-containing protein [Pseudodesulfovibrio sediminis]BCS88571.1 metal-binding protein [Pseudodesulfovibrio sediminis]
MENSFRFFNNHACKYFPCHKTSRPEQFNCLFCYCPLYFFEECGGRYEMLESGVKDCTNCMIPHTYEGYDHILGKLKERFARMREAKTP